MDRTHFLQCDLLERGWTKSLISRLLGQPDEIRHRYGGGEFHLFECKRVERAEKRKLWQTEVAKSAARRETRRISALTRQLIADYIAEVHDRRGDESDHWSDHPAVAPYMAEARKRKQQELLAQHGIFPSLNSINREAKREREASQAAWRAGDHESAAGHKERKEALYWLKGQALEHLWRDGEIERAGWHRFPGGLIAEVLAGGGYRFHRPTPVVPEGVQILDLKEIEAKPVKEGEVPAHQAEEAVRGFLQNRPEVEVYEWPERERKYTRWGNDWDDDEEWSQVEAW